MSPILARRAPSANSAAGGGPTETEEEMPDFLVPTNFLGQPCGQGAALGVLSVLKSRLEAADAAIQGVFNSLSPNERIDPATGSANATFSQWCALKEPHLCWRPHSGHHSAGAALDINTSSNPYIATRNGDIPGGEDISKLSSSDQQRLRNCSIRALQVCDRAMQFKNPAPCSDRHSSRLSRIQGE